MKTIFLLFASLACLYAQTVNVIVKVDTDDDPSLAAVVPRPIFSGTVTIRLQPIATAPKVHLTVTIPSTDPAVAPIVYSGTINSYHPEPEWFSVQIAIPSGFKVDMDKLLVEASVVVPITPASKSR